MKQQRHTFTLWIVIILLMALLAKLFKEGNQTYKVTNYPEFSKSVLDKNVKSATIILEQNKIKGEYVEEVNGQKYFELDAPSTDATSKFLSDNGITPNYEKKEEDNYLIRFFYSWGPMLLLIAIFYFFLKQLQAGGGKAMSFGKSRARMLTSHDKKVTFKDVSGVEEAKEELHEVVDFLKDPKKYTALGGKIPKGVILVGPPGTGKTLLARAVAGEANVPFFSISGSDFVEMFVGVGASRVRDLFEQGKKHAPCIIFIDEIDAVGRHRGAGMGGGHDEREQTLNQLLVEMDGFESNEGVILIAATNRIDVLDPALLRPGRFDRRVTVGRPDVRGRLGILRVHTRKTPLADDVDLEVIAKGTPGFTGADLANLVNEAALTAARLNKKKLENSDFESAKDKVLMGPERKSMVLSDKEKLNTAYHEAGHTIVGMNLPQTDPIHKVSIMPRGGALGVTQTLPDEEMLSLTNEKAKNNIAFLMGGRCAEEIKFGEYTNGATNDIERATQLAYHMVCNWGMSKEMGPRNYHRASSNPFGNSPNGADFDYSDETAKKIDAEVQQLIMDNYNLATKILKENEAALDRLADGLMVWETLDFNQVKDLVEGKDIGLPIVDEERDDTPQGPGAEIAETKEIPEEKKGVTSSKNGDDPVPA